MTRHNPVTTAYVFGASPASKPTLAGELELRAGGGQFRYAPQWLEQEWAYPLDPVNLPLSPRVFTTRARIGVFGVFSDAGPDDWGTRVMLHGHSQLPANELERLLATNGHGAGALHFSLSRTRPKHTSAPSFAVLEELEQAAHHLASNEPVSEQALQILLPGSSMGGARPKVTLRDENGAEYIAKFSVSGDVLDIPRVEHATLQLAAKCGIDVVNSQVHALADRSVLLVRRFDRDPDNPVHFISAHSLFHQDRIRPRPDALHDPCGYPALARILRIHADSMAQCHELYRRMVFNILIGNTDDHAKNHAMLYHLRQTHWSLSPAYDLLPIISGASEHALGIGTSGRQGTLDNARSACNAFGLNQIAAEEIIQQVSQPLRSWREHYLSCGVNEQDVQLVAKRIEA
ncbi:MAG: type II toxin-antitoxin system HipA family toxin [Pseudomonadota bacterium]